MKQVIVAVDSISKEFVTRQSFSHTLKIQALDKISIDVAKGETLAIVGESGSGKSTLARQIMRLSKFDEGKISMLFNGELTPIYEIPRKEFYSKIQMVFQDPYSSLNPRKRIWQLVSSPLAVNRRVSSQNRKDAAAKYLKMVGVAEQYLDAYPHQLSGGQRQRVGIARALVTNPEVLILDEPLSALDMSIQAQIINLLLDLQQQLGLTYIIISHALPVVKFIADSVGVMYSGRLVEYGVATEVIEKPIHPYTKELVRSSLLTREDVVSTKEFNSTLPSNGCQFAPRCQHVSHQCLSNVPANRNVSGRQIACVLESIHLEENI
ncbi:oligopeptide/dipeptide ABC transporter ATP-binding protein [Vibrio sagamiensis]|uniref:Dipeptide transport ATP-binding protein DppF n=1 Tax=Vibrio sagamiensis NBRC 104589 TaxID=1219064 RepID=A0A511QEF4_9VIBR|nr:oligopeptide/dipeptide ABC transporter ATP-binding protein [Vibrio sagamiensis]PNQ54371.1 oligopeptide ABC transporter ATP-binding protein OppF [Vibrio agarivorans]GEM74832.1 dipeptide transport ATP-binding protein DppF [Vibrio sagamiensis NBRC 104589]